MLFERTCRIKQDFDWFLRFVPPNSVEKRKISKHHPENGIKTSSTILSPACLEMFEPSKAFSMLLFMMPSNQTANAAQLRLKSKNQQASSRNLHKKTGSTILSPACLEMFEPSKAFSMLLYDVSESECQRCTTPIKMQKISKNHPENGIKTGSTILSSACLEMFEPSKAFSMLLFMMPANQTASRCNQNQNANDQRCHLPVAFP